MEKSERERENGILECNPNFENTGGSTPDCRLGVQRLRDNILERHSAHLHRQHHGNTGENGAVGFCGGIS